MVRTGTSAAPDEALVEAAQTGDREAMNALLERHFDLVHAVCRRVLWRREHADALEQARQEALLRIARGIAGFNAESTLTTWIHRIATNASLDALSRHQRTPVPTEVFERPVAGGAPDEVAATRLQIDHCLDELDEPFREAVVLYFLCDLDHEEIATRLGVPVGTAKSRIHRGRAALKSCLTGGGEPSGTEGSPGTEDRLTRSNLS